MESFTRRAIALHIPSPARPAGDSRPPLSSDAIQRVRGQLAMGGEVAARLLDPPRRGPLRRAGRNYGTRSIAISLNACNRRRRRASAARA
jgi:hypothetical protein